MRCGICGKTTMRGHHGEQVPISSPYFLALHKKAEHPTEYRAAIAARRMNAETTRQAKADEAQRVSDARLAASRPVVYRYHGEGEPETYPSSKVNRWHLMDWNNEPETGVRFPDAEAYREYLSVMATIAKLEGLAMTHLTAAWECGTPVTMEHLDELDRAAITKEEGQD